MEEEADSVISPFPFPFSPCYISRCFFTYTLPSDSVRLAACFPLHAQEARCRLEGPTFAWGMRTSLGHRVARRFPLTNRTRDDSNQRPPASFNHLRAIAGKDNRREPLKTTFLGSREPAASLETEKLDSGGGIKDETFRCRSN